MKIVKSLTRSLLFLTMLLLAMGQLQRIQVTTTLAIYVHDIVLAVWCGGAVVLQPQFRKMLWHFFRKRRREEIFLAGWIILGLAVSLVMGNAVLPSLSYLLRLSVYVCFGFLLYFNLAHHYLRPSEVFYGFLLTGFLWLFFGFLQFFLLPDTRFLFFLGWDDHYHRLISTILDPGFVGILFVLTFWLLQFCQEKYHIFKKSWPSILYYVGSLTLGAGVLLTYSRASFLAYICGLVFVSVILLQKKHQRESVRYILIAVVFVALIPFLPQPGGEGVQLGRSSTVNARTESIKQVVERMKPIDWILGRGIFVRYQLSGITANSSVSADHGNLPDNWLLMLIAGTGVVGTALFCWLGLQILKRTYRKNIWLFVSTIALLIHGLFDASLVYPFVVIFFAGFTALSEVTQ